MTVRHELETQKINPDDWKVQCLYPWMLVNWICLCFSLLPYTRTLTLIVVDSSLKIEEFLHKMAISLKSERVKQNNHSSLAKWPDRTFSSQHLRRFLGILSVHVCIHVSLPPHHCALLSAFGLPRLPSFSQSASLCLLHLSLFCPRHNTRKRSLFMRVLSHSDTHHLNRHMVGCGCHEILISCSTTVLFLTTFLLISISRVEGEGEFI